MPRVPRMTFGFHRLRLVYAPRRSPEDAALRRTMVELMDERKPLPAPTDTEELPTPFGSTYTRRIRDTDLLLLFAYEPPLVHLLGLRPARW